jgi:hypothetical protein
MDRHQLAVRLFLRSMARRGTPDQRPLAARALADKELLEVLADDCCTNYEMTASGSFQSFLEWLLENADAIFALIAKLIDMFSETA